MATPMSISSFNMETQDFVPIIRLVSLWKNIGLWIRKRDPPNTSLDLEVRECSWPAKPKILRLNSVVPPMILPITIFSTFIIYLTVSFFLSKKKKESNYHLSDGDFCGGRDTLGCLLDPLGLPLLYNISQLVLTPPSSLFLVLLSGLLLCDLWCCGPICYLIYYRIFTLLYGGRSTQAGVL